MALCTLRPTKNGTHRGCQNAVQAAILVALTFSHAFAQENSVAANRDSAGLLVHYPFEDAQQLGQDSQGIASAVSNGELTRVETSAFAGLGKAAAFKSGAHLAVPDLGEHSTLSIELWINLHQLPSEGIAALYAADSWQANFLHFNLLSNGAVEFAVNGAGQNPNTEPEFIPLDRWVLLTATYDSASGQERIYRDGRLQLETVVSPSPPLRLVPANIGVWRTPEVTRPLVADLDEVRIYSRVLEPGEIRAHYLSTKGVSLQPVDFAKAVQPLLAERCSQCHGPDKQEGGLRLDIRDWVFRGGDSGEAAVRPYESAQSHLMARIADSADRMPPEGDPLAAGDVALLRDWIDQGAPWPEELAGQAPPETVTTDHWSFLPITRPKPPELSNSQFASGHPIDAFIEARLQAQGLSPSPQADPKTLVRRLFLDVHGLPPDPAEIERFAADPSPKAWQALVDQVLASPRYAERWASHWLDTIRYGDTHGFEVNTPRENSWPYRDYVIKSLHQDKPYDQFILEQVAGDQLGLDAATGFLVAAPALLQGQVGRDLASMRQARQDELHEVIVSVGSGVLGISLGCARCHNHKFDPISQKDYYQVQALVSGVRYGERPLRDLAEIVLASSPGDAPQMASSVFSGQFTAAGAVHRLNRGDPMQRREQVAPNIPAVFGSLPLESTSPEGERRLALGHWLGSADNPLTARVIVNRVWQHHFGTGIVATPSDFGKMGVPPSHPELLDFLAGSLIDQGWSLKAIHRLILTSSTYQQSAEPRTAALAVDFGNTLLWRFQSRRLEMEPIRDSMLAASGALDTRMGGPGFLVFKPNDNYVRVYDPKETWGPDEWRRMIYAHRVRMAQDGTFGAFDCPDAGQPAPRRSRSTTPVQALNLLNSSFTQQQAEILGQRAADAAPDDANRQLAAVFLWVLGRTPTDTERAAAAELAAAHGLPAVCRALFNSNEFLFIP